MHTLAMVAHEFVTVSTVPTNIVECWAAGFTPLTTSHSSLWLHALSSVAVAMVLFLGINNPILLIFLTYMKLAIGRDRKGKPFKDCL